MHRVDGAKEFRADGNVGRSELEDQLPEVMSGIERNLNDLVQGLGLLGVKRCCHCKKFFRASDPGTLFDSGGGLVCFDCIPGWWAARREQLACEERQEIEGNLVFWLRSFHHARSFKDFDKPSGKQRVKFELMASCLECRGTGTYLGDKRCRYCDGPGTVRVVVPERS